MSIEVNGESYDLDAWAVRGQGPGRTGLTLELGQSFMIYGLYWQPQQGWALELNDCAVAHVDRQLLDDDATVRCALALAVPTPGPTFRADGEELTLSAARLEVEGKRLALTLEAGDRRFELDAAGAWNGAAELDVAFRVHGKTWRAL